MTFRQFAFNNVKRNTRHYLAFFFSSIFSIMIFFIYAAFIFHPDIGKDPNLGSFIREGMAAAEVIIYGFSFLFVLYSVGHFLKVRKREFGVLTVLGISNQQLNRLLFLENLIIGVVSIFVGVLMGILLTKAFFLAAAAVFDLKELSFYFPVKALGLTIGAFLILFLIIPFFTRSMIQNSDVIGLLKGSIKPKAEPKASLLLVLLSVGTLFMAYYLASQGIRNAPLLWIMICTIVGTYFFFSQLSVYLVRWLKSKRSFFWKGSRILWLSDLAYRIKDNTRLFFLVTMVFAVAFTAIGNFMALEKSLMRMMENEPFAFYYLSEGKVPREEATRLIDQELGKAEVSFDKLKTRLVFHSVEESGYPDPEAFMKWSDYHQMTQALGWETQKLQSGETLVLKAAEAEKEFIPKQLTVTKADQSFQLSGESQASFLPRAFLIYVVPDNDYQTLSDHAPPESTHTYITYVVPEWLHQFPQTDSLENKLGQQFLQSSDLDREGEYFFARGTSLIGIKQGMNAVLFVGLFVAVIFFLAAASFLYFRLYADLEKDQHHYRAVSKIGLTEWEMKRSVMVQIAILFFLPFMVAVVHTFFALQLSQSVLDVSITKPAAVGIGLFFLLQLLYFGVVCNRYLVQVKRILV
ncbi:ABC transporter permease [Desmospora profundinema]|uniref:ABC transport system permease protein n=1 Tax=Desmospora profundinema TaxID=1571184 RepID=A0ABU1II26_9BACL|nr:ABC transporter permease [Desmospora profundinema]MDR6224423.1 putative ABC transport system permease protein [Desmospora profundinema]